LTHNKDLIRSTELYIIVFALLGNISYSIYDETEILGADDAYYLKWHIIPFLIVYLTLLRLFYNRYRILKANLSTEQTLEKNKSLTIAFISFPAVLTIIAVNLTSISLWTEKNKLMSKQNNNTNIKAEVVGLYSRKSKHRLKISFQNKIEYLKVDKDEFVKTENRLLKEKMFVLLDVTKSYDNYWILNSWDYK
jgi:hypothetical protein